VSFSVVVAVVSMIAAPARAGKPRMRDGRSNGHAGAR
jgi:hypothetical protein